MQTTAIGTVTNSLPQNEVILLTLLISGRYISYTDLMNNSDIHTIVRIISQNRFRVATLLGYGQKCLCYDFFFRRLWMRPSSSRSSKRTMTQWVHRLGDGGRPFLEISVIIFMDFLCLSKALKRLVVVCISGKWRTAGNDTGYSTLENICIARLFRGNVSYPKPVQ